jgi:SMI1 / KNR4 family (SUKH-1)
MRCLSDLLPTRDVGVAEVALALAEQRLGHRLPQDLRDFLRVSDGSQWADFPQCGCQVLSLSELMSMWELPEEHRAGPPRLIDVASDGSRERFCLDPASGHIVMLDISWEEGEPPICARTLTELVSKLADGWNPFEPQT